MKYDEDEYQLSKISRQSSRNTETSSISHKLFGMNCKTNNKQESLDSIDTISTGNVKTEFRGDSRGFGEDDDLFRYSKYDALSMISRSNTEGNAQRQLTGDERSSYISKDLIDFGDGDITKFEFKKLTHRRNYAKVSKKDFEQDDEIIPEHEYTAHEIVEKSGFPLRNKPLSRSHMNISATTLDITPQFDFMSIFSNGEDDDIQHKRIICDWDIINNPNLEDDIAQDITPRRVVPVKQKSSISPIAIRSINNTPVMGTSSVNKGDGRALAKSTEEKSFMTQKLKALITKSTQNVPIFHAKEDIPDETSKNEDLVRKRDVTPTQTNRSGKAKRLVIKLKTPDQKSPRPHFANMKPVNIPTQLTSNSNSNFTTLQKDIQAQASIDTQITQQHFSYQSLQKSRNMAPGGLQQSHTATVSGLREERTPELRRAPIKLKQDKYQSVSPIRNPIIQNEPASSTARPVSRTKSTRNMPGNAIDNHESQPILKIKDNMESRMNLELKNSKFVYLKSEAKEMPPCTERKRISIRPKTPMKEVRRVALKDELATRQEQPMRKAQQLLMSEDILRIAKNCRVCHSKFALNEKCVVMSCRHIFHLSCGISYFKECGSVKCPVCISKD